MGKFESVVLLNVALLFILFRSGHAQQNFVEGYIVSQKGDTTYGFINYQEWSKNPSKIEFKESREAESRQYAPDQLHSFRVAGAYYRSKRVQRTARKVDEFLPMPQPEYDTLFLRILVKGEASLYLYKDVNEYFYLGHDNRIDELVYQEQVVHRDDHKLIQDNDYYKNQLRSAFSGCQMQSEIEELDYSGKALKKLFRKYNQCIGSEPQYVEKPKKFTFRFGVIGGYTSTQLVLLSKTLEWGYGNYGVPQYDPSRSITLGMSMHIDLPGNLDKWAIYTDLTYISTQYETVRNYSEYLEASFNVEVSYLKMDLMARYQVPVNFKVVRPFANLGITAATALKTKNHARVQFKYSHNHRVYVGKALSNINDFEAGLVGGLGTYIHNFSFEFRYGIGKELNRLGKSSTYYSNHLYFLVGYRF